MGSAFSSDPTPWPDYGTNPGYVAIVLRYAEKVRVLYGPEEVLNAMQKILLDLREGKPLKEDHVKPKCGSIQYRLPGAPFFPGGGKDSATIGKYFCVRLLEEMFALGYDYIASSDMSRFGDTSTIFFRKVVGERPKCPVACVAPGSNDKLVLVNHDEHMLGAVKEAIASAWSRGISYDETIESMGQNIQEISLHGFPWSSSSEESTQSRKLLSEIISQLSKVGWKFHAVVSIKGTTDSLFFMKQDYQFQPNVYSVLSLNRTDRIRLIDLNTAVVDHVKNIIMQHWQPNQREPEMRDYYGATEYKLRGNPFHSSGQEAIATRRLICRILEGLRYHGWMPLTGVDLSRKVHDKSVVILKQCPPLQVSYACVSMSDVDRVRLIDFPSYPRERLAEVVRRSYGHGISTEYELPNGCLELNLNGTPWTDDSETGLHGRSMMLHLLKTATGIGWHLVASLDVSAKYVHRDNAPDYPVDVHSWYLTNDIGQAPPPPPQQDQGFVAGGFQMPVPTAPNPEVDLPPSYSEALQ